MKITAIILFLSAFNCQAQIFENLFKEADKSFNQRIYYVGYGNHASDTLQCRMLVTTETRVMALGGDTFIYSAPFVINGYEIFPAFGQTIYLTIDKKPLPKNYTVWISKEKY